MSTFASVLQSIAFTEKRPTERKPGEEGNIIDNWINRRRKSTRIRVCTSNPEYTGVVTEIHSDYFVMKTDKKETVSVIIAHVQSFQLLPPESERMVA